MISFVEEGIKSRLTNRRIIKRWICEVASSYGYNVGNLCYIFCDDEYILGVNRQYLQHDYYTDIITFDYVDDKSLSVNRMSAILIPLPYVVSAVVFVLPFSNHFSAVPSIVYKK